MIKWIFNKITQWNTAFEISGDENDHAYGGKHKFRHVSYIFYKTLLKMNQRLNIKCNTVKLLENKIRDSLDALRYSNEYFRYNTKGMHNPWKTQLIKLIMSFLGKTLPRESCGLEEYICKDTSDSGNW